MAAETRWGVFFSPSRPGSSPRWRSISSTSASNGAPLSSGTSASRVLHHIPLGLPEHQAYQPARRDRRGQPPPALYDDVLRGGIDPRELRHVEIEVPMVHPAEDVRLDQVLERLDVDHVARRGIDLPRHRDLEVVVVPVVVGVGARSEDARVLRLRPGGIEEPVRGVEVGTPHDDDGGTHRSPSPGPQPSNLIKKPPPGGASRREGGRQGPEAQTPRGGDRDQTPRRQGKETDAKRPGGSAATAGG